jgi:hypothetical protein
MAMELVYLRFGTLPIGGKSYNREKKKHEAGVGVWEAIQEGGTETSRPMYRILLPRLKRDDWQAAMVELHASHGKPCFLVTGKVLKGFGSFGETLLSDVKIVDEVNPCAGRNWRELLDRPLDAEAESGEYEQVGAGE